MPHAELSKSAGSIGRAFAVIGRVLGWSMLGAVCGVLLGLGIGVIHAPTVIPGDPLAHEWYTPFVFILIMPVECLAGLLIGAGIAVGVRSSSGRRNAFRLALGGAVLGVGLGWVLARVFHVLLIDWGGGSELVS